MKESTLNIILITIMVIIIALQFTNNAVIVLGSILIGGFAGALAVCKYFAII